MQESSPTDASVPVDQYLKNLHLLDQGEQKEILALLEKLETADEDQLARNDFLAFVKKMWPGFIGGRHHKIMADIFERVAAGTLKRVCISMPPRHSKSEFSSYLFLAWFLGRFPDKKIIQCSHTSELAKGFGRKVRNLIASPEYQRVFSGVKLAADNKAAGRWMTNKGGEYFAIGVGGACSGKGADCLVIDDPSTEQEAALAVFKPDMFEKVYEWYTSGPRQRMQPNGAIIVIHTRWSSNDLIGKLIKASAAKGETDEWEVIELPAILPSGSSLWPEFWPLEELLKIKADIPASKWNAQYQQQPTAEEGAIIKREWWKTWKEDKPPENIEFIIQTWDTAFSSKQTANYSASTTWGIFTRTWQDDQGRSYTQPCIILLDAYKKRVDFPELKAEAMRQYKYWKPDAFIVEGKATGGPLIYELRSMGIPVTDFVPTRGTLRMPNDKTARLNSISDIFRSGLVYAPDRKWADEVINEVASFPYAESDDLVDTVIMAMIRYRQGGFIKLDNDEKEDEQQFKHRRKAAYY